MKDAKSASQQRPEDFMDEEDLREAEEARVLSTSEGFAGLGTTKEDVMRTGGLMDIFRVAGDTVGVRLLKRMGWREGQGIGPKVRRAVRTDDGEAASNKTYLFAPDDPQMISFNRKTDHKGLGYSGEARLPSSQKSATTQSSTRSDDEEDTETRTGLVRNVARKKGKTGGFGVGILNDTGSDDEDPYQMGPKILYTKVLGGAKKLDKKKKSTLGSANPLVAARPVFTSKKVNDAKSASGFRKCHDGRFPLDGFVLSSELDAFASISLQDNIYKPLEVPPDWKSSKTGQQHQPESTYVSAAEAAKASSLNAQSRSALLGEEQLPGKSVFDFLSPSARERIVAASGRSNLPAAGGEKAPKGYEATAEEEWKTLQDSVPHLDSNLALQALARGVGGWMPYAEDEAKRSRYRAYLETQAGTRQGLPPRGKDMSKDDWVIEMQEFARAAQVFKPVDGLIASRFTSSSVQPQGSPDTGSGTSTGSLVTKPASKPEDPAEAAAKLGMFGPMTRSVQNFYPTRLLCKRFNVKPPAIVQPESGDVSTQQGAPQTPSFQSYGFQTSSTVDVVPGRKPGEGQLMLEGGPSNPSGTADELTNSGKASEEVPFVVDAERNEALEGERPGEAIFKAIFGSDDDDE
jgi:G patch domain-containing protein 1